MQGWRFLGALAGVWMLALPAGGERLQPFPLYDDGDVDLTVGERGLVFFASEPELELRAGGRFHLDFGEVDEDVRRADDDADVRRARLYGSVRLGDDWRARADYEFADERSGWRGLWAEWRGLRRTSIRVGNQIAPLGLEQQTSSNHVVFVERSLAEALSPGFQTGVSVRRTGRLDLPWGRGAWTVKGGAYTSPLGRRGEDVHKSEHGSLVGRVTLAPIAEPGRVLHLGGSFEHRDVRDGQYRVRTRPESQLLPALLNTGRLQNVSEANTWGAEVAWVWGPVSMEGQFLQTRVARKGASDPRFHGASGQISWFVTGESRPYSRARGAFSLIEPQRKWGAIELAGRYSTLDLNDASVRGGRAENVTLGVNWYLWKNLRVGFNYVHVNTRRDDPQAFVGRVWVFF